MTAARTLLAGRRRCPPARDGGTGMDRHRRLGVGMTSLMLVASSIAAAPVVLAGKPARCPAHRLSRTSSRRSPITSKIQNTQQREWLRFSTTHINAAPGNLQVRGGAPSRRATIDGSGTIDAMHARDAGAPRRRPERRRSPTRPASRSSTRSTTTGTSPASRRSRSDAATRSTGPQRRARASRSRSASWTS